MGNSPANSGESTCFSLIHIFLKEISMFKEVRYLEEIDSDLLDKYISYKLEEKKIRSLTLKNRIDEVFKNLKYEDELEFPPNIKT